MACFGFFVQNSLHCRVRLHTTPNNFKLTFCFRRKNKAGGTVSMSHRGVVRVSQRKSSLLLQDPPGSFLEGGARAYAACLGHGALKPPLSPRSSMPSGEDQPVSPAPGGQGKRVLFGRSWQALGARTGVSPLGSVSILAGGSCPKLHLQVFKKPQHSNTSHELKT